MDIAKRYKEGDVMDEHYCPRPEDARHIADEEVNTGSFV